MQYVLIACALLVTLLGSSMASQSTLAQDAGYSLRLFGNGTGDADRVKIPVDAPPTAVDIGGDFTIEFFIRVPANENGSGSCVTGDAGWTYGNIIVDRDIFNDGDYGDYGIALFGASGVIGFGVSQGGSGETLCGSINVVDEAWHHIAVTRSATTGVLSLYVDGVPDGTVNGPTGDVSYRDGRPTGYPNDPFIVIGAEKHDYDPAAYPSYSGWIDELRISTSIRYAEAFTPPTESFVTDEQTVGLYHFDEGTGDVIGDSSGTNSNGTRHFGGTPAGPEWSPETPFTVTTELTRDSDAPSDQPTPTQSNG